MWDIGSYNGMQRFFVSPNGKNIALEVEDWSSKYEFVDSGPHNLEIWDGYVGTRLACYKSFDFDDIVFSPDGDLMAIATLLDWQVWDLHSSIHRILVQPIQADARGLNLRKLGFSQNGKILIVLGWLQTEGHIEDLLLEWDISTGIEIKRIDLIGARRASDWSQIAFSPATRTFAFPCQNGSIAFLNAFDGTTLYTPEFTSKALACAFSPDGSMLVTTWRDSPARIFNTNSGQEICRLKKGGSHVKCAFSPLKEDPIIITGSDNGVVRIWDIKSILPV
nr:hypothetical protein [Candidatus Sigynarchaeota archaeon]